MRDIAAVLRRCGLALLAATALNGIVTSANAADVASRRPHWTVLPYQDYRPDPGPPPSTSGYYGYYGYDIVGVPYQGLYSEPVTCLRSLRTPEGYRTVDVCR